MFSKGWRNRITCYFFPGSSLKYLIICKIVWIFLHLVHLVHPLTNWSNKVTKKFMKGGGGESTPTLPTVISTQNSGKNISFRLTPICFYRENICICESNYLSIFWNFFSFITIFRKAAKKNLWLGH